MEMLLKSKLASLGQLKSSTGSTHKLCNATELLLKDFLWLHFLFCSFEVSQSWRSHLHPFTSQRLCSPDWTCPSQQCTTGLTPLVTSLQSARVRCNISASWRSRRTCWIWTSRHPRAWLACRRSWSRQRWSSFIESPLCFRVWCLRERQRLVAWLVAPCTWERWVRASLHKAVWAACWSFGAGTVHRSF